MVAASTSVGRRSSLRIDLTRTLELLFQLITSALCESVFRKTRSKERQRAWSLLALIRFWVAVILRAPASLSQALIDVQENQDALVPRVQASPEAFFERCRDLHWKFFAEVFRRFVAKLVPIAPPVYCAEMVALRDRFPAVLLIDGSRLAAIAHRLKILWNERAVVLPGCVLGVYDLFRGIPRLLDFDADAAKSEMTRAKAALKRLVKGSLLVGDRLYCTVDFFAALAQAKIHGVFRRNQVVKLKRLERRRKKRYQGGILQEWLVLAGSGQTTPQRTLRLIRWQRGKTVYELLTDVLETEWLPGEEALALYPCRWSIERMYFDLKEVLNLNRFYAANPNAIAMQVYAGAMVYAAMRVAQAEVALQAGIEPEAISPAKFFPRMAAACHSHAQVMWAFDEVDRLNPGQDVAKPNWKECRYASVPLRAILREKRNDHRRKRRFCKARRQWKSLKYVRGGRRLLQLS